jgi:hypothetical protein
MSGSKMSDLTKYYKFEALEKKLHNSVPSKQNTIDRSLLSYIKVLERQIMALEKRIEELEKEKENEKMEG